MSVKRWKISCVVASMIMLVLGGCSQGMKLSAEEIIHNAIESEEEVEGSGYTHRTFVDRSRIERLQACSSSGGE